MGFTLSERFVRGTLFKPSGKYGYTVVLEYSDTRLDFEDPDLGAQACKALARATANGRSGVTLSRVPPGWSLVVLDPYSLFEVPVMVKGQQEPGTPAAHD